MLHLAPGKLYDTDMVMLKKGMANVRVGGKTFKARTATLSFELQKGLAGVTQLGLDEGMLFNMSEEGYHSFWMKGMEIPIDIIFINKDKYVVDIRKGVSPNTPDLLIYPAYPATYALEVAAGASIGLKHGAKVNF